MHSMMEHPGHGASSAQSIWRRLQQESQGYRNASHAATLSPLLSCLVEGEPSLEHALTSLLASKLADTVVARTRLKSVLLELSAQFPDIIESSAADLSASVARDPACLSPVVAFLFFKGFHATQAYRFAHALWQLKDELSASWIQSRCSALFGVDIHPAAVLGDGIFIDHATGIVIGETAVIGSQVSLLHGVTLGGTGKEADDRHPKVGNRVLISANATVLGNIRIGDGARIGACSVVLKDVPPYGTVVGNPATLLPAREYQEPAALAGADPT